MQSARIHQTVSRTRLVMRGWNKNEQSAYHCESLGLSVKLVKKYQEIYRYIKIILDLYIIVKQRFLARALTVSNHVVSGCYSTSVLVLRPNPRVVWISGWGQSFIKKQPCLFFWLEVFCRLKFLGLSVKSQQVI